MRQGLPVPTHVGVVMDGNRRWARSRGFADVRVGHRRGADHIADLLGWCDGWGIDHLSLYVLSADNLARRARDELDHLGDLLSEHVPRSVSCNPRWSLHVSGDLDLLAQTPRVALRDAETATAGRPAHVTMAIGYDPHDDLVSAIRRVVRTRGAGLSPDELVEAITASLAGGPVTEIDLVIRTSGEQRLSGFFPWQSAHAHVHLSPRLWPDFGPDDFERALTEWAEHRPPR